MLELTALLIDEDEEMSVDEAATEDEETSVDEAANEDEESAEDDEDSAAVSLVGCTPSDVLVTIFDSCETSGAELGVEALLVIDRVEVLVTALVDEETTLSESVTGTTSVVV